MKSRLTLIIITALIAILIMAGCAAPATPPPPTQVPPTQIPPTQPPASPTAKSNSEIVLSMVERLNAGDVEGSLAYFSDDATVYIIGFPPTGIEVYKGKEPLRSFYEDCVNNHFEWEMEVKSVSGDVAGIVNVKARTWHDFTRQLEVAPLEYTEVFEVKDGKIVTYGSWLSEESLARFRPAFEAVMPPEPTAEPPSDPAVSEMTVTIANGSCTTNSPLKLKAGEVKVTLNVEDQENSMYLLTLFNMDPGKDILDMMVGTVGLPPSWVDMLLEKELGPGKSETTTFTLEKGPVYMVCWSQPPDLAIGNAGPIFVEEIQAVVQPAATPMPVIAYEQLIGKWRSSCGAGPCTLEFKSDGRYRNAYINSTETGITTIESGNVTFTDGILHFVATSGGCKVENHPNGYYTAALFHRDNNLYLLLTPAPNDECPDRRLMYMRDMKFLEE